MKKKLIWIIGGMGCGKSTLRRNFCEVLTDGRPIIKNQNVNKLQCVLSVFDDFISVIGEVKIGGICDGLDASFPKLKKEGCLIQ